MLKISENNGTEEIGLVTPTPGPLWGTKQPFQTSESLNACVRNDMMQLTKFTDFHLS